MSAREQSTRSSAASSVPLSGTAVRARQWLHVASGVCVLAAIALWFWPVASDGGVDQVGTGSAPPPVSVEAPRTLASALPVDARVDSLVLAVVSTNVFSATRRAPTARFVVPGQAPSLDAAALAALSEPGPVPADSTEQTMPHLSGIVAEQGERRALLQLVAADGRPRLYREGDVHAGFRILRIGADHVVLSSRTGSRTVRLSPRVTPDSLEMKP